MGGGKHGLSPAIATRGRAVVIIAIQAGELTVDKGRSDFAWLWQRADGRRTLKLIVAAAEQLVATSRYRFECRQTAKILKLEDTLKSRRVVNKAVGKLATERGMSDDAAYQFIRRCSLERHLSMTKVADLILSDEEPGLFKPL